MTVYNRGVNQAEISGPAWSVINKLQNLYNGLNIFEWKQKLIKILLSTGIILVCDLINIQLQTC